MNIMFIYLGGLSSVLEFYVCRSLTFFVPFITKCCMFLCFGGWLLVIHRNTIDVCIFYMLILLDFSTLCPNSIFVASIGFFLGDLLGSSVNRYSKLRNLNDFFFSVWVRTDKTLYKAYSAMVWEIHCDCRNQVTMPITSQLPCVCLYHKNAKDLLFESKFQYKVLTIVAMLCITSPWHAFL